MANAISDAIHDQATTAAAQPAIAAKPAAAASQKAAPVAAQVKAAPIQDTVNISSAAQSVLKEAVETSVQTAQEARGGDRQAQRLLAKEASAKKVG
jgi:hypothetical protein